MKAVVYEEHGGVDKLKVVDATIPAIRPTEVLVRVAYCGVNPVDEYGLSGRIPTEPMPHILGSEIAGTVEAVGDLVTNVKPGDRVAVAWRLFDDTCEACLADHEETCYHGGILGIITQGGYAEYVRLPALNAIAIPEGVTLEQAAAVTLSALTAWHMLLDRAKLQPGERVLIIGATGGVGVAALEIAKMVGAYVIAVGGSPEKAARLRQLGADHAIDRRAEDISDVVLSLTNGLGVDVVVDPVGSASWPESYASVARNGRWTTCGTYTGAEAQLNLANLYGRQVSLIGSTGGKRKELCDLLDAVSRGLFKPVIWKLFPLAEAARAFVGLKSPDRVGKVLLQV